MAELKGGILQAVANPKQFLWAPFELAIMNLIMAVAIMLICVAVLMTTPFFAMIPMVLGHIALVIFGAKDQHLFTIVRAMGIYPNKRKNLSAVSVGVKYVP
jgi:CHASE2 domain-containing sensor protein